MPSVPCPTCGRTVEWKPTSRWRPFCSERCKLIDLGAWASGQRAIPGDEVKDEGEHDGSREGE
ncbi:MAG: DNA gyrase inhibitor YacG [Xanthomonadaceae bacterium]|nr:DNA gyrase inhibitor YacG [Xanthomonadaceae bacterium]